MKLFRESAFRPQPSLGSETITKEAEATSSSVVDLHTSTEPEGSGSRRSSGTTATDARRAHLHGEQRTRAFLFQKLNPQEGKGLPAGRVHLAHTQDGQDAGIRPIQDQTLLSTDGQLRHDASKTAVQAMTDQIGREGTTQEKRAWFEKVHTWAHKDRKGKSQNDIRQGRAAVLTDAAHATGDETIRYENYKEVFNQWRAHRDRGVEAEDVNAAASASGKWNVGRVYLPGSHSSADAAALQAMNYFHNHSVRTSREFGGTIDEVDGQFRIAAPSIGPEIKVGNVDNGTARVGIVQTAAPTHAAWHTHHLKNDSKFSMADKEAARILYNRAVSSGANIDIFNFFMADERGRVHVYPHTTELTDVPLDHDHRRRPYGDGRTRTQPTPLP